MPIADARPSVLFLNWRDLDHPEGGGSERYVHRVAEGLAAAGADVTLFCAAHDRAPAEEVVRGVRVVRRGGRFGVYPRALLQVRRARPDLVVDVQNGVPFGSTLVRRGPVLVLLHHVHREQWTVLFGRVLGALGWFLESRVAPRLYRRCRYVTVSGATADELAGLGVARGRTTIVTNGVDPAPPVPAGPAPGPRLVVLGRLVPHKRVERAIDAVAAWSDRWPDLQLDVVGEGWWRARLVAHAQQRGVADRVHFHGFVDDRRKHELLARAWVHLCPSVKEGWGIVVTEAAGHGVPTVAHRSAGGLRESVLDGRTGVLVDDDPAAFEAAVGALLADPARRARLGAAARADAARYTWAATAAAFSAVVDRELAGRGPAGRPRSAAAVLQDLDGAAGVRRRGRLLAEAGGPGEDHADAEDGAEADRRDEAEDGLHVFSLGVRRVRRSATVIADPATDNVAQVTMPSVTAPAPTTAATRPAAGAGAATASGTR